MNVWDSCWNGPFVLWERMCDWKEEGQEICYAIVPI